MPLTRPELRALLAQRFNDDSDFSAFVGDYFPDVYFRFTNGMDRVERTSHLLNHADLDAIARALERAEASRRPSARAPVARRIKFLFLAANPLGTTDLHLTREAQTLTNRLGDFKDRYEFVPAWAVRRSELQRWLLDEKPDVIHFSGHGDERAQLLLEDDEGYAAPVEPQALVDLISLLHPPPGLVVLNACDTAQLAGALAQHVACAIGMQGSIRESAAIAFGTSLYHALARGEPIERAFQLARNNLKIEQEEGMPVLVVKEGTDATKLRIEGR